MKLKTLKDIGAARSLAGGLKEKWYLEKDLKAEAVKEHILLKDHYDSVKKFPFKILNDRERKVLQAYIKWKNNITEDDLKVVKDLKGSGGE